MFSRRKTGLAIAALMLAAFCATLGHAQAALLIEQPYGFFGTLNPTGHNAIYFEHICADSPTRLRMCLPGEMGSVIARYEGIENYDWVAIPLLPYLYSVETGAEVPDRVDRESVERMRDLYRERHLEALIPDTPRGNLIRGGWTQLVGAAYERRIYALRFDTTEEQDEAVVALLNDGADRSHFNLLYSNCADFARQLLNVDFPHQFHRSIFPDALMTTPKQLAWRLERYSRKHPDMHLAIYEIPQIPGYRRMSRKNKGVAESLITTVYAIPIVIVNPYLAGGLFVDYLVRSRYRLVPKDVPVLSPDDLSGLTWPAARPQTPGSAVDQAPAASAVTLAPMQANEPESPGQKDIKANHE
jgi:hypothetical protein